MLAFVGVLRVLVLVCGAAENACCVRVRARASLSLRGGAARAMHVLRSESEWGRSYRERAVMAADCLQPLEMDCVQRERSTRRVVRSTRSVKRA